MDLEILTLISELITLGDSKAELEIWERIYPVLSDDEKNILKENLKNELMLLKNRK